jgi:hypothetical protein
VLTVATLALVLWAVGAVDAREAPRRAAVLTTRELAGLWHPPQAGADVPLLERTTARERLPLPGTVARGCRIGVSAHQGREVPVALADELLGRHLLLVAKTRRGKSSLLLRLARYAMEAPVPAAPGSTRTTATPSPSTPSPSSPPPAAPVPHAPRGQPGASARNARSACAS